MKPFSKKMITGTIAASFLLGGGLVGSLYTPQAQAADAAASVQNKTFDGKGGQFNRQGGMGFRGNNIIQETATLLGVEQSVVQDELKSGKTLVQIAQDKASLSETDFLAKLVAAESTQIDAAVTSGKLTQDQADKQKTNLSDRLKKEIENTGFGKGGFGGGKQEGNKDGKKPGEGFGGFRGGNNIIQETATVLGVEQSVVMSELKAGKTLVQIAQDKASLSETDFLAKLVAAESTQIDAAVTSGKLKQEQADKQKTNLADRLKKEIENAGKMGGFGGGFQGEHGKGGGFLGNQEALVKILGVTQAELQTQMKAGKSLAEIAEAKGISKDSLISQIKDSMTDQITKLVDSKKQPREAASTDAASTN